jgi:hypothetical protein
MVMAATTTTRQLGDAGEYLVLAEFTFAGRPAFKANDGWPGYDLGVDDGVGLKRVSVRTRTEPPAAWTWFPFKAERTTTAPARSGEPRSPRSSTA